MLNFFLNLLLSGAAVFVSAKFLPGVHITDFMSALLVAFLLGIVNSVIRPLLLLLTLPINFLTLGIFTFVINALMILLVDTLVGAFSVDNFWWAVIFSFVLSIISSVLHAIFPIKNTNDTN
jgi:putative membrane protein